MIFKSPAKINLALDILGEEENGYHLIDTIYQIISLFDVISIKRAKTNSIKFEVKEGEKINNKHNTVQQVLEVLKGRIKNSYEIIIKKNIPAGAGLGGGSSDAAAVIKAINTIEELKMDTEEMRRIGAKIGADVPCFIKGKTMIGRHYGENISLLPDLNSFKEWRDLYKVLIIPERRKKTKEVYSSIDIKLCGKSTDKTKKMLEGLKNRNFNKIINNIHNDFEIFAGEEFAHTKKILEEKEGALRALLCGSGTAVFAVSNNPFYVEALSRELPNQRILNLNQ